MQLELIRDSELCIFVESRICGGSSVISKGFANSRKCESSLIYLDDNGLYSYAMTQPLSCKYFKWATITGKPRGRPHRNGNGGSSGKF